MSRWRSAWEDERHCQAEAGTCRRRAVGVTVLGSGMIPHRVPVGVPIAVCEYHYQLLDDLRVRVGGARYVKLLARYSDR